MISRERMGYASFTLPLRRTRLDFEMVATYWYFVRRPCGTPATQMLTYVVLGYVLSKLKLIVRLAIVHLS